MGVSENRGTPKSSILIGISIINHPFWGTTIFGNTQIIQIHTKWTKFFGEWWRRFVFVNLGDALHREYLLPLEGWTDLECFSIMNQQPAGINFCCRSTFLWSLKASVSWIKNDDWWRREGVKVIETEGTSEINNLKLGLKCYDYWSYVYFDFCISPISLFVSMLNPSCLWNSWTPYISCRCIYICRSFTELSSVRVFKEAVSLQGVHYIMEAKAHWLRLMEEIPNNHLRCMIPSQ